MTPAANTVIISSDTFAQHKTGFHHPESPSRVTKALSLVKAESLPNVRWEEAIPAANQDIERVHSKRLIKDFEQRAQECSFQAISFHLDSDMMLCRESPLAARLASGAATQAVDLLLQGKAKNTFILSRPPGHHANQDKAFGFCYYNHIAVGARYALAKYPQEIKKILIVDWDLHHGNGTQEIFTDQKNIYYFGVHLEGIFPFNPAESHIANDHIYNVPITKEDDRRRQVFSAFSQLEEKMRAFKPDLIFISAGFDGHKEEIIEEGGLGLDAQDYGTLTNKLRKIANSYAKNRIISILEGGYAIKPLSQSILSHITHLQN